MKNLKQDLLLDLFNLRHGINGIFSPSTHSLETTQDATEKLKVNTYIAKSINSKLNGYFEGLSEEDRYKGTIVEDTFDIIRQSTGNYAIVFTNKNYSTEYKFEKVDCNFLFSFVYNDQINKNNNSKKFRERIFSEFSNFTAENRSKNRLSRKKTRMLPLKGLYKNTREVLTESLRTEEIDRILDAISQDELKDFYNIQNKVWKNYYYYYLITYDKSIFEDLNNYLTPYLMQSHGFKEEPAEKMKLIWDTYYNQTLKNSNIETLWNFTNNTDYEDYKQKLIQSYIDTHVEYLKTRNAEDKKIAKILLKEKTLSDYTNDEGNEVIDRLKEFVEKINESSKWKELFNGEYIKYTLSYKVENEENIKLKTKNSTYRIHYIDFTDKHSFLIRFKFNQNISGDIRFDKVRLFSVIPEWVDHSTKWKVTASYKVLAEKKKVISKIYLGDKIMDKTVLENIFTIIKWFLEDVTKNERYMYHLSHNENNPNANYISLFVKGFNNYLKFNNIEKSQDFLIFSSIYP